MVPPSPATGLEAEYRGHTVWQETQATCEHFQHEPAINLPYLHPTPQKGTHMKVWVACDVLAHTDVNGTCTCAL